MEPGATVRTCHFAFADALEFDPQLRHLMTEEPVSRIRMPYGEGDAWLVTGYEDVRTVTTDRRFSRDAVVGLDYPRMTPEPNNQAGPLNMMDPPAGSRLRRLIAKGFTPRCVDRMRERAQRVVDGLLDGLEESGSPADLVRHMTSSLPMTTICEVFDIPEEERPRLCSHARTMTHGGSAGREDAKRSQDELRACFSELAARRRADPGDDLISALARARDGDEFLDDRELAAMAVLLFLTGQEPTSYELVNISYTLLSRPELYARLRERPETLPRALEELLRFIPFRKEGVGIPRVAMEDVVLSGARIKAGDIVHVSYLTANRDANKFDRPDELDLDRPKPAHMTFGWGSHHCLGAPLAAMELQVAFGTLIKRFPGLRLAVPAEEVRWNTGSIWRHPVELPVAW
ncbi:cytochrome P450 [Streptomyces eurocidicus]|uniref:Cytochrome P450 n=1 Tax=Streptomyces eurocidicus TaxID=66423 RepID=A0A2N8NUB1_STREU|nr:cytochrome P450 [Streptomyces eurocidicus]MBB5120202.1 cytochrome P450 [Streptomyces eurocidicus]MBF6056113.1 cytochrome P450 [Streptomyces eurocidicus]PNE32358.1 cytochrome P450 [Streptomyces eurocidicus]